MPDHVTPFVPPTLATAYATVRARTLALIAPLSDEDCCAQSMPDASPAKWHLAHTAWFFETFVLERHEPGFRAYAPGWRVLFNSYYQTVGERHPRPERGLLTRPSLDEVIAYRLAVDERVMRLLQPGRVPDALRELVELGLHHEQQHQELLLTDVKHLLSRNLLAPAYRVRVDDEGERGALSASLRWHAHEGGLADVGADGSAFAFDNEGPRHRVFLAPFALASRLSTNAEYSAFVDDGGYRDARWWLAEGWDWLQREGIEQPMYWRGGASDRREFTLAGEVALDPSVPVCHLSHYEADAFARWSDARLPTEFEWEHAFRDEPVALGHWSESDAWHPARAREGASQAFGDCWEWTSSSYAPYPGFRPKAGAIGEYNGKFMANQYVLRGGSCVTPAGHARATYRNFFPSAARWQFSGVRLARDVR